MEKKDNPQVFSKHLTSKAASEHLLKFNNLLVEMMTSSQEKPKMLEDITVLEVSHANFPAIISASILGEFGANVIKIEPPEGDPARKVSPFGVNVENVGIPFLMESRNKNNITLDFTLEKGLSNFKKLASQADVIIDAMKPGYLDSLGIGYRQLKQIQPGLMYLAISPYGHFTEKARKFYNIPDTDLTAQAEAGYPSLTGDPTAPEPLNFPVKAGVWAASYMSAALAVAGTLTALLHKRRTGEGQFIDVATYDCISAWQSFSILWGVFFRKPRVRVKNFDWNLFPYGYYKAKDGYVTIAAGSDQDFRGMLKVLGRWDLENDWRFVFDRITDDIDKLKGLEDEFKKEIIKYTRKEIVQKTLSFSRKAARDKLRGNGFPIIVETLSPREVLKEEHWQVRNSLKKISLPDQRDILMPDSVPKMSVTPPRIDRIEHGLGVHNEEIYEKYNLDK